ncbi:hypothetical protein B1756_01325 [Natrarchaeobaculum aegyptiacum]|uniref:Uncharacterized protein n=1 Tax=Natrarchaeobaculum aegyptiacum TaxID=745377 RepID=A0A2Z2HSY4_9EURY|nr:hypothetical protein B1756_01325 [Natrarchaeobaculum aegyptiacum]
MTRNVFALFKSQPALFRGVGVQESVTDTRANASAVTSTSTVWLSFYLWESIDGEKTGAG